MYKSICQLQDGEHVVSLFPPSAAAGGLDIIAQDLIVFLASNGPINALRGLSTLKVKIFILQGDACEVWGCPRAYSK